MVTDRQDQEFIFDEFMKFEQQEKELSNKVIEFLDRHQIPTPNEVQENINRLAGGKRKKVLRHHVFWTEHQLRLGLESLVRTAHQAYIDVCRHDAALGALSSTSDFESHVDQTVGYAAQKDVMAYCSLATIGVSDTLRRIKKRRSDITDQIQILEDQFFEHDDTQFIKELRNNLSHGSVVIPQWQITFQPTGKIGSMMYPKNELLATGSWNKRSQKYVSNVQDENLCIATAIGEHNVHLENFYQGIKDLFARTATPAEEDFFNIEDTHKLCQRQQRMKILIGQIGKGKDPYDYLHRFFDPTAVRKIMRLTRHSKEQVDFIIGLKSTEIGCDDELRHLLYEKFGVKNESK
ncbi:MAG: hypothetical protein OXK72_03260 [Gammaproteobacteria bacterium]|nr:hypothetical protein [Gammaproteobacteria bacterium]MDE0411072.1 hypothetical protein [Gammaproteobacteria bacterium]